MVRRKREAKAQAAAKCQTESTQEAAARRKRVTKAQTNKTVHAHSKVTATDLAHMTYNLNHHLYSPTHVHVPASLKETPDTYHANHTRSRTCETKHDIPLLNC